MNKYIKIFIILIILSGCTKKESIDIFSENEIIQKTTERNTAFPYNNIKAIRDYIMGDLNLKWDYPKLEDFLVALNITENYTIQEKYFENPYANDANDYICVYTIEYNQYKLKVRFSTTHNTVYFLISIRIEISEDNFLFLFPYKEKNQYLADENFGEITEYHGEENDAVAYVIKEGRWNDEEGNCYLIFENGILKAISISPFIP